MPVNARWAVALSAGVLAGLAALVARGEPPPLDARLSVRGGSLPAAQRASAALARIPARFAPARVRLEQRPILGVECERETGSLLLGNSAVELPDSVWLHELAHVRMHGARPQAPLAQRVLTAFEGSIARCDSDIGCRWLSMNPGSSARPFRSTVFGAV